MRYSDPATIHRIARAEYDLQPSPYRFDLMPSQPYFVDVLNNPDHFVQQMGLFRVKLGYVAAGYVLWRMGLPILVGLRLISACCLFILGLAVLAWTGDAVSSFVLLLTPPVLNLGRLVTADALTTTLIVLALIALVRGRDIVAAGILIATIVVRPDNLVYAFILLAWMIWKRRIRFSLGATLGALAVFAAASLHRIAGVFGWRLEAQDTFVKAELDPISHPVLISFTGYLHALTWLRVIPYTFMTIWVLVAAVVWKKLPQGSIFRELLPLAGVCIVLRLLLWPNVDDRFFVWAYLLAGVALIRTAQTEVCLADRSKSDVSG